MSKELFLLYVELSKKKIDYKKVNKLIDKLNFDKLNKFNRYEANKLKDEIRCNCEADGINMLLVEYYLKPYICINRIINDIYIYKNHHGVKSFISFINCYSEYSYEIAKSIFLNEELTKDYKEKTYEELKSLLNESHKKLVDFYNKFNCDSVTLDMILFIKELLRSVKL